MTDPTFVACGPALSVHYLPYRGRLLAKEYLDCVDRKEVAAFLARVKQLADHGRIHLQVHGHMLRGRFRDILELKFGKSRAWGFRRGPRFYVTNAGPKEKRNEQEADFELALKIRHDFTARS